MAEIPQHVKALMVSISQEAAGIDAMEKTIAAKKILTRQLQLQLWDACEHSWARDPWVNFDDCCKCYCTTCGLWKDRAMYS
jgi:hypothetical protein